jgi:hypothetical protein
MGFHDEAVRAFEAARDRFDHRLSGAALAAYESSRSAAGPQPDGATVEGWSTGEIPPSLEPLVQLESSGPAGTRADDEGTEAAFFTRTEDEMKAAGRDAQKAERRQKSSGRGLAVRIVSVAAVLLALAAGLAFAWSSGLGYPTQRATVAGMLDAYRAGADVTPYWVAVPPTDIKQEMRRLPARFDSYSLDAVDAGPSQSTAHVTVRLDKSAVLRYEVWLVREGVGWRVNGIQNDWGATGAGS